MNMFVLHVCVCVCETIFYPSLFPASGIFLGVNVCTGVCVQRWQDMVQTMQRLQVPMNVDKISSLFRWQRLQ